MIRISEKEWEVMKVIWMKPSPTASEIVNALTVGGASWHPKTTRTFLHRLVNKGLLRFRKKGRVYHYVSEVAEKDAVDHDCERFLCQVFDGSIVAMVQHFIEREKLSTLEKRALIEILGGEKPLSIRKRVGQR